MVISILASTKLISILAKDMVQSEVASSLVKNLLESGRRILSNTVQNVNLSPTKTETHQGRQPKSTEYLVYNWLENLFAWFQMIILWHDPYQSIFTISGLFSSFLLLTYIAPRFYATVLIAIFVYNLTKVWFKHVWPEIRVAPSPEAEQESIMDVDRFALLHPHLMTLSELGRLISNLMKIGELYVGKLLQLRREKPGSFCLLICSILSCTAYVGSIISGLNLTLFIVAALVSGPGIYLYLLPAQVKQYLSKTFLVEIFHQAIQESIDEQYQNKSPVKDPSQAAPSTSPSATTHSKTLFDNLLSMAYQSNAITSQEKAKAKETADFDDENEEDDDQHDFVIL